SLSMRSATYSQVDAYGPTESRAVSLTSSSRLRFASGFAPAWHSKQYFSKSWGGPDEAAGGFPAGAAAKAGAARRPAPAGAGLCADMIAAKANIKVARNASRFMELGE